MYQNGDLARIIISPGPGHPKTDSGISKEVITWAMGKVPVLGICMGLECLVDVLGGEVSLSLRMGDWDRSLEPIYILAGDREEGEGIDER